MALAQNYIIPSINKGKDQLYVLTDIVSAEMEVELIDYFNTQPWQTVGSGPKSRRVQHYGRRYDYKRRADGGLTTPFPPLVKQVTNHLAKYNVMPPAEQCIVNEYQPGVGISTHTDIKAYGRTIVTLGLGEDTNFIFRGVKNTEHSGQIIRAYHPRRSLLVMSGIYRYYYSHDIPARKTVDLPSGQRKKKVNIRISLTLRTMES